MDESSIRKDMKNLAQASGGADISVDDLKQRGVSKINVLTPQKVEEMVRQRAMEMLRAKKDEILGAAAAKLNALTSANKDLRSQLQTLQDQLAQHKDCFAQIDRLKARVQDLTAALEQTRGLLEQERAKSFQSGVTSQAPVVEKYRDEILALKTRIRELEEQNKSLASPEQCPSLKDEMKQYREQIAQMTQEIRSLRQQPRPAADASWKEALGQTEALITQYREEISALREQVSKLGRDGGAKSEEMQKMVSRLEDNISERISKRIDTLRPAEQRPRVKPREAVLDNLFNHEVETNIGAMKVRQKKGDSVDESLERLKSFQTSREDLEMQAPDRDAPAQG
jgi:uncharacterized phage infection (PIP) family protein YhgE